VCVCVRIFSRFELQQVTSRKSHLTPPSYNC